MKKLVLLALSGVLLASCTGCGSSAQAADADYIYGQIDSVSGNDIVLLLADYHEDADSGSDEAGKEKSSDDSGSERKKPDKGNMPEGFNPENFDPSQFSGEKPEGFSKPENGEMPEGFDPSKISRGSRSEGDSEESGSEGSEQKRPDKGEMPEGFDPSKFSRSGKGDGESEDSGSERKRPDKGDMPEGFDPDNFDPSQFGGKMPGRSSESEDGETAKDSDASKSSHRRAGISKYTLTGEQEELRIPVGTTVTTAAGVETDFDVLKPGDYIRCTVETDSDGQTVITSVQIMEA